MYVEVIVFTKGFKKKTLVRQVRVNGTKKKCLQDLILSGISQVRHSMPLTIREKKKIYSSAVSREK